MAIDVAAGLHALNATLKGLKAVSEIRDEVTRNLAIIDLTRQLYQAVEQWQTLTDRVRELEAEIAEMKAFDADAQDYELKEVGPDVFAQVRKLASGSSEPSPWYCPNCFSQRRKSPFQRRAQTEEMGTHYVCGGCDAQMWIGGTGV